MGGFNIPILNHDTDWVKDWIERTTKPIEVQKKLVLVVVSIALLLDNMLYMVIVPIIPKYLRDIHAYEETYEDYTNETRKLQNGSILVLQSGGHVDYLNEEIELGWLFASKALLQIFVNPLSGFIIDRVGYEIPMIIGLVVMFSSTAIFALGRSYGVLFFARSLQGFGSAFADTSGLAMIADRFTEESERSAALGIALAFISFGCLVAPPFGSVLYSMAGKPVPFLILALVCLIDGFLVFMVIQPKQRVIDTIDNLKSGEKKNGTPMWRLFMDPFIAVCSGALIMANISLAFLEPTITNWITETMPDTPDWMMGMIWLPAFFPHVLGVYVTVKLLKLYPHSSWILAAVGLAMEGISCAVVPFMTSMWELIIPLSTICFGIALIDTSLLPLLGYLVDTRHVSVYGSVYAIADISYSLAYAFGPIIAGSIVHNVGFLALNILICVLNVGYTPVLFMLRKVYNYETINGNIQESQKLTNIDKPKVPTPLNSNSQEKFTGSYQYNDNWAEGYGGAGSNNYTSNEFQAKQYQPTQENLNNTNDPFNVQW
ncbi:Vesicular acetylcholine transporter [Strongyloides ratti]|uniref:Vesicular acetylcholine transporter n=1 Tax=Strongyloides ratti TaxID=34506 RepID=A0A090MQA0_STRRB|nr:Vesicular acetylcholine transporter [Strongyloides ratti]CEF60338.1 Vesicular acetylcholine transporter [Strongyloides ratti]